MYRLVKFHFKDFVHFGDGTIESCTNSLRAYSLFSALFIEGLKVNADLASKFYDACKNEKLLFSDLFPFANYDNYYLPKPMLCFKQEGEKVNISKKIFKNSNYISIFGYRNFISNLFDVDSLYCGVTKNCNRTLVDMSSDESNPYLVGTKSFNSDAGLYIIVHFEEEKHLLLLKQLLDSHQYTGIGGKKSLGYGRFEYEDIECPHELLELLKYDNSVCNRYITLSSCMFSDKEQEDGSAKSIMNDARYLLHKREGFVDSNSYSNQNIKRKPIYLFSSGSVFYETFRGDVFDLNSVAGRHSVYCYGKPLFIGVTHE